MRRSDDYSRHTDSRAETVKNGDDGRKPFSSPQNRHQCTARDDGGVSAGTDGGSVGRSPCGRYE